MTQHCRVCELYQRMCQWSRMLWTWHLLSSGSPCASWYTLWWQKWGMYQISWLCRFWNSYVGTSSLSLFIASILLDVACIHAHVFLGPEPCRRNLIGAVGALVWLYCHSYIGWRRKETPIINFKGEILTTSAKTAFYWTAWSWGNMVRVLCKACFDWGFMARRGRLDLQSSILNSALVLPS